jgi:thiamine-monophosphate kinase
VRVSEIGEFGLIELLAKEFGIEYPPSPDTKQRGLKVGLGDDAAVTERRDGALVWTTDTMVAGVHFLPDRTAWEDVGWKALAVNLSDIAAMGGTPYLALVTLMLPPDFCVEDAVAVYRGLHEATGAYDVILGGGDLVSGPVFAITVALAGWAATSQLGEPQALTRNAARPGDVVAVSGHPGSALGGLELLRRDATFETEAERRLRTAYDRPQPRVELGKAAIEAGIRCAIDISDGLLQDAGHIARASRVHVRIEAARLPVDEALKERFPAEAAAFALRGGDDYELILVGPRPAMNALLDRTDLLTEVGEVIEADEPGVAVIDETGREIPAPPRGWDHFRP